MYLCIEFYVVVIILCYVLFFYVNFGHLYVHVRTHSVPTLRSSGVARAAVGLAADSASAPAPAMISRRLGVIIVSGISWARSAKRARRRGRSRSEEHTSDIPSPLRISYAVFCLITNKHYHFITHHTITSIVIVDTNYIMLPLQ